MVLLAVVTGVFLIVLVLWDGFETVVLPRRVTRRYRLVRLFYRVTWPVWSRGVQALFGKRRTENMLSYYGPFSMILLLALWAFMLIIGFALLYRANGGIKAPGEFFTLADCLYFSASSFFTLGLGDIVPVKPLARALVVTEAGLGFGFLAMVISYLPAINQSFSRREVNISLLDARAGSPPTAGEILRRHARESKEGLTRLLADWERWSAEILESHLSFPVLVYFRSQHDNQSWLAALTAILDTSAFAIAYLEGECVRQASLTFAMARHTLVDLALVLHAPPREPEITRLAGDELAMVRSLLVSEGVRIREGEEADARLHELRGMYESYIYSLSARLFLPLPPWILKSNAADNWQISAWGTYAGLRKESREKPSDRNHF